MQFEVSARTILQLGRELISSDGVAFYELIKNAFDAQEVEFKLNQKASHNSRVSKEVWVRVVVRLPFQVVDNARTKIAELPAKRSAIRSLIKDLTNKVDLSAPGATDYVAELEKTSSARRLYTVLDDAATIEIEDFGEGMSPNTLSSVYLLIGTPSRRDQQAASPEHVFLGEKGIGRLSTMRLGDQLFVETATIGERAWNTLEIDWRDCEAIEKLDDINVEIDIGNQKEADESGTLIVISALRSAWTESKLREIARTDLSRFVDPFAESPECKIHLSFNDDSVGIPPLNKLLFSEAHAIITGGLSTQRPEHPVFKTEIDFRQYDRVERVKIDRLDLISFADADSVDVIESLGPFSFVLYWYNRQALTAVEGLGTKQDVQKLVKQWSGGLMLYRDGFRVPPYGSHDDDWLGIDKVALGSGGYKVNRAQIVGKIDITKSGNPRLVDQTNREGLQDTPEKQVLETVMFKLLMKIFKPYIDTVAEEYKLQNAPTISELKTRFDDQKQRLHAGVRSLKKIAADNPELGLGGLATEFSSLTTQLSRTLKAVNDARKDVEARSKRFVDLAGLGLLADIIAHDLNVSLSHSLSKIAAAISKSSNRSLVSTLTSAEAQLKTLQKRVRVLDKWSISGRQRKSRVCVYDVVQTVFDGRSEQFKELGLQVSVSDSADVRELRIKFVEGMLYQILENLTENSVYWIKERIKDRNRTERSFSPKIVVEIDAGSGVLFFSDNGPGIAPENAKRIFGHAFSLKRNNQGKGLGLYISQQLAKDQGASLDIVLKSARPDKRLNKFVLDFSDIVVQ